MSDFFSGVLVGIIIFLCVALYVPLSEKTPMSEFSAKRMASKPPAEEITIHTLVGTYRVRAKRIGHGWEQTDLMTHDAVADLVRRLLMPRDR